MFQHPLFTPSITRTRVESRILDIPLDADNFSLTVLKGQTLAVAKNLRVVERRGESNIPEAEREDRSPRHRDYAPRGHVPFVRLDVNRFTKKGEKTYTGDGTFDLQNLRNYIDMDAATLRQRWYSVPAAFRAFEPETIARLVELCDWAMEQFNAVDWAAEAMTPEEQR